MGVLQLSLCSATLACRACLLARRLNRSTLGALQSCTALCELSAARFNLSSADLMELRAISRSVRYTQPWPASPGAGGGGGGGLSSPSSWSAAGSSGTGGAAAVSGAAAGSLAAEASGGGTPLGSARACELACRPDGVHFLSSVTKLALHFVDDLQVGSGPHSRQRHCMR